MTSSSARALRVRTVFLLRQARSPFLHLSRAMFFCLRPREDCDLSLLCFKVFTRKQAKIRPSYWKSRHTIERVSKQQSKDFQASQHRMSVPKCLLTKAHKAIEAIKSFAPMQSSVCLDSSRFVIILALYRRTENSVRVQNWVRRKGVVVMKLLQDGTAKWHVRTDNWEYVRSEVRFWMTKSTAAWSLGLVFFQKFSKHEKSNGNHVISRLKQ